MSYSQRDNKLRVEEILNGGFQIWNENMNGSR